MYDYFVSNVNLSDTAALLKIDALLEKEGIKRDRNLDYISAVYDMNMNVIATGSLFENTLRCFAVSSEHQGEGLLAVVLNHLLNVQVERGITHAFLYTKPASAKFFEDQWFSEIARVDGSLVFMENKRNGFSSYLEKLSNEKKENAVSGCIVMNANPFTKGHRYLVEKALKQCDYLHVFVLSEDKSLFPYEVRLKLVQEGLKDLKNISIHASGSYIISNATFPSYFLKDEETVMKSHAELDAQIFVKIAKVLNITKRFVGTEPRSLVTGIYNSVLFDKLPQNGIELIEIPRLEVEKSVVSASDVRLIIKNGNIEDLKKLVPDSTYKYLISKKASSVIESIKNAETVVHH